ncbi:MAG: hypothetical protein AB8U78_04325 [Rickettsia slovaca]|uniref:Uncharacterized protein n=2 Tax=Rickettsia slovaca TaxID=35794 RepID=H8LMN3_RICSL|nr:hypothetical protein [Rickettsia slovaca]AEV92349.1 hypothetical protein Rsl_885 [Rickettsia slovaca 13-B]AFD19779.1 hypothetical protein MC3_04290 [Rickettsia slovaca str. D-CWPP]
MIGVPFAFFAQAVGDWLETGQISGDTQTGDICFQLALVGTLIIAQAFSNLPDYVYNEYVKVVQDSEIQVTLVG